MNHRPNPPVAPTRVQCVQCGYNLTGATIGGSCPECGTPVNDTLRQTQQLRTNGTATTSMVLGILSLAVCAFLGPFAIIAYVMAMREINGGGYGAGSKTMATAGLVMGIISTLITLVIVVSLATLGA